ncbi:unnamed protein product, partial [Timema podura]|nr:unnamed protein product [Timema podura]
GPGLYYVDSEGTRTKGKVFSVGSGSVYAFGVLDSGYNWDLTDDEAYELGRRSIYHATFRDAYSGGIIRVYHMKSTGWVNISNEDCKDLHYKYQEEKDDKFVTLVNTSRLRSRNTTNTHSSMSTTLNELIEPTQFLLATAIGHVTVELSKESKKGNNATSSL